MVIAYFLSNRQLPGFMHTNVAKYFNQNVELSNFEIKANSITRIYTKTDLITQINKDPIWIIINIMNASSPDKNL